MTGEREERPETDTAMLDRMARAMFRSHYPNPSDFTPVWAAVEDRWLDAARAALGAIREPSLNLQDVLSFEAMSEWQDAIDAILQGKA